MKAINNGAALSRVRQGRRRAKCLAAAVAAAPLFALPAFGTATAAAPEEFDALRREAPVLMLSWGFPISLLTIGPAGDLRGEVCEERRTCELVSYPWLDLRLGAALVDDALNAEGAPGNQIIYAYSQGARVATDWLDRYADTADAPTPDELSLVLLGNPGRIYGGGNVGLGAATPATDYLVLDVARQYDWGSDVPDDPFNLLAMVNTVAGFGSVHMDYQDVDIYDPANYVWTEKNTTYVFVPAKRLPILEPLYVLGLTEFADSLDAPLRAAIEKGYDRSYLPAQPGPPAEAEPEPEPEELSAEPDQTAAAAVALPSSRSAIVQDQNDTANLSADSTDSRLESELGSDADAGTSLKIDDPSSVSTGEVDHEETVSESDEAASSESEGAAATQSSSASLSGQDSGGAGGGSSSGDAGPAETAGGTSDTSSDTGGADSGTSAE